MKRKKAYVLLCLFLMCSFACQSSPMQSTKERLGPRVAFDYYPLTGDDVDYLSWFDVIVTHDLQDAETVKALRAGGGKVFFYEWLPAFYYDGNPDSWERRVYRNRETWTLDPDDSDPDPMGERYQCRDFFYDMANRRMIARRIDHLSRLAKKHGYDGIFFDWGSGWHALQEHDYTFLTEEFERRHPNVTYDQGVASFLRGLRRKGLYVILNGGFRSENAQLDRYADADVVESMFTTDECDSPQEIYVEGEGVQEVCDTWFNDVTSSADLAQRLPSRAAAVNPDIRFFFLNYAFPFYRDTGVTDYTGEKVYERTPDRQAIFYALALSYLGNAGGFTNGPYVSLEDVRDDVYLESLGTATGDPMEIGDTAFLRHFTSGFVVVSDEDMTTDVEIPSGVTAVIDLYDSNRIEVSAGSVDITLTSETYPSGSKHPIGRIYRYAD